MILHIPNIPKYLKFENSKHNHFRVLVTKNRVLVTKNTKDFAQPNVQKNSWSLPNGLLKFQQPPGAAVEPPIGAEVATKIPKVKNVCFFRSPRGTRNGFICPSVCPSVCLSPGRTTYV